MGFILDTSIVCNWALKDETHPTASLALKQAHTDTSHVPYLWWFEIRNALLMNERRKRLTQPETQRFLGELGRLTINIDQSPNETEIFSLARQHNLTVYDAAYLELAKRENVSLATLDKELAAAACAEKIQLIGK